MKNLVPLFSLMLFSISAHQIADEEAHSPWPEEGQSVYVDMSFSVILSPKELQWLSLPYERLEHGGRTSGNWFYKIPGCERFEVLKVKKEPLYRVRDTQAFVVDLVGPWTSRFARTEEECLESHSGRKEQWFAKSEELAGPIADGAELRAAMKRVLEQHPDLELHMASSRDLLRSHPRFVLPGVAH